jgi:hypothetical protein
MSDSPQLKHEYGTIDTEYGLHLATRPPEADGPIYMVNLMKYHEVAQYTDEATPDQPISGRDADDRYNPASVLAKIGATIVFVGDVVSNHTAGDDWDRIAIVRYPTRKSFIEMQTRRDFADKHVHKAAGMQRTTIVCCRPEDSSLDQRGRPTSDDHNDVVMVVRKTSDRASSLRSLPNAVNFLAEGTIIGDGRKWDTVQFVPVASADEMQSVIAALPAYPQDEAFVMGVRASADSITRS